jgi:DNA-directed RNA polymerase subunit RPC12/RpoP
MTDDPIDEEKCYQCGWPLVLVYPDDDSEDSWIVCDNCGERVITVADFKRQLDAANIERAKRNLGFDEYLLSLKPRGVE